MNFKPGQRVTVYREDPIFNKEILFEGFVESVTSDPALMMNTLEVYDSLSGKVFLVRDFQCRVVEQDGE